MVESEDFAAAFSWICKKCAIILLDHPMCATDNYMVNEDSLARTHARCYKYAASAAAAVVAVIVAIL